MTSIAEFDTFLRKIGVETAQNETSLKSLDLVVLTVVHVAIQLGCEPEFELNLSNIIGVKGDDGRVVYPKLSFAVRSCPSALQIAVVPLFDENATIHALWAPAISDTRKVTTMHLNPKPYTSPTDCLSKGLVSHIRAGLLTPLVDGTHPPTTLQSLPDPLLVLVLTHLSPREVCRCGQACGRLSGLYRAEIVWQPRCGAIVAELRGTLEQKRLRRRSRWGHGPNSVEGMVVVPPSLALAKEWAAGKAGYEVYRAAAKEIQAAEFFLPKGHGSAYPQQALFRHYAGLPPLSLLPDGQGPVPVCSGGLVLGFRDGGPEGGLDPASTGSGSGGSRRDLSLWGAGHRTATVPYGAYPPSPPSSSSSVLASYGLGSVDGVGSGDGSGLVLPRATPNPYTIGLGLGSSGGGRGGELGSFGFGFGFG